MKNPKKLHLMQSNEISQTMRNKVIDINQSGKD